MATKLSKAQYAAYDSDDNFLDVGTAEEMACAFDTTANKVRQSAKDNKRKKTSRNNEGVVKFYALGRLEVEEFGN